MLRTCTAVRVRQTDLQTFGWPANPCRPCWLDLRHNKRQIFSMLIINECTVTINVTYLWYQPSKGGLSKNTKKNSWRGTCRVFYRRFAQECLHWFFQTAKNATNWIERNASAVSYLLRMFPKNPEETRSIDVLIRLNRCFHFGKYRNRSDRYANYRDLVRIFAIFCDFFLRNQIRHWEKTKEECRDLLPSMVSLLGTVESSK